MSCFDLQFGISNQTAKIFVINNNSQVQKTSRNTKRANIQKITECIQ